MSNLHELKRAHTGNASLLRPGEYMAVLNSETWTVYKCPECGYITSLAKLFHVVNYNGEVSPHVSCPHKMPNGEQCKFTGVVRLANWVPEAKGSA